MDIVKNRRLRLKDWFKNRPIPPAEKSYISQLINGKSSFREKAARRLEEDYGMGYGYLDMPIGSNIEPGPDIQGMVPLISWVQAGEWCEIIDNFQPGDAEEWLPIPRKASPSTYALRVRGVSMEPKFQAGDIIFVDPEAPQDHGKCVIVRLDDKKEATFKQLIIEGDQKLLRALNPDWPDKIIPVNGNATICGVVIGKWVSVD